MANKKGRFRGLFVCNRQLRGSALARLEARVALADHEDLAATTDDLAVAVTGLGRLEGRQDFHGNSLGGALGGTKKEAEL
jgi:hypothetical protein